MALFDITSDVHIDMYYNMLGLSTIRELQTFWSSMGPKSPNLIIAGDLGHFNHQAVEFLSAIKKFYKTITCVTGNHDYYTCYEFQGDSKKRIADLLSQKLPDGVRILDGEVIVVDGVSIGGAMGWYDGSYMAETYPHIYPDRFGNPTIEIESTQRLWNYTMNDSRFISIKSFDELFEDEYSKLRYLTDKCDIIISHINPSNLPEHQNPKYKDDISTCFYNFDGTELTSGLRAKYWIYGHTHSAMEYTIKDCTFISNPLGYPRENPRYELRQIEITP